METALTRGGFQLIAFQLRGEKSQSCGFGWAESCIPLGLWLCASQIVAGILLDRRYRSRKFMPDRAVPSVHTQQSAFLRRAAA